MSEIRDRLYLSLVVILYTVMVVSIINLIKATEVTMGMDATGEQLPCYKIRLRIVSIMRMIKDSI